MFLKKQSFFPRGKFTPPKGRFFSSREKIADNFTSPRKKTWERHIPPIIPIFPRVRPSSPRYRDKFTSPKDMVRHKHVFSRERVIEMEMHVRCIIPPRVFPGQR